MAHGGYRGRMLYFEYGVTGFGRDSSLEPQCLSAVS